MNKKNEKIISAFCGTGKTYLCENSSKNLIERECWRFDKRNFPENYTASVKKEVDNVDAIFISSNKLAIDHLISEGFNIALVYPEILLKDEYMERYRKRGSHPDFITMIGKHWNDWIRELEERRDCSKYILQTGQFIPDVLPHLL